MLASSLAVAARSAAHGQHVIGILGASRVAHSPRHCCSRRRSDSCLLAESACSKLMWKCSARAERLLHYS
jgi:hypothetical protein